MSSAVLRERLALKIAPWLYFHNRDAAEEAFADLSEIAYGSRKAVWTSHRTLVRCALERKWNLGFHAGVVDEQRQRRSTLRDP